MTPETPAQGILKINEWGNSKMYHVACDCGNDDCAHTIDIEASDCSVDVTIYATLKTNYWSWNGLFARLRLTWDLWIHGHARYQSTIVMREQVALNYAEMLKSAVADVKAFREERLGVNR